MVWQALTQSLQFALIHLQQLAVLSPVAALHLGAEAGVAGDPVHDRGIAALLAQPGALPQLQAQQAVFRQQSEFRRP